MAESMKVANGASEASCVQIGSKSGHAVQHVGLQRVACKELWCSFCKKFNFRFNLWFKCQSSISTFNFIFNSIFYCQASISDSISYSIAKLQSQVQFQIQSQPSISVVYPCKKSSRSTFKRALPFHKNQTTLNKAFH